MPEPVSKIKVGSLDGALYICVGGRATRAVCPTATRIVDDYLAVHGTGAMVIIDLSGCEWVDSTFAGCLVALRKRLTGDGRVQLTGCSEICRGSLARMRLDTLLDLVALDPPEKLTEIACTPREKPTPDDIRLMLDAHRALMKLGPENERVFGPIVQMLEAQLND